jgi:hypothetical protein
MFNLADIFQLVVNGFNDSLFSQDNLVVNEHEGILHVLFQFGIGWMLFTKSMSNRFLDIYPLAAKVGLNKRVASP